MSASQLAPGTVSSALLWIPYRAGNVSAMGRFESGAAFALVIGWPEGTPIALQELHVATS